MAYNEARKRATGNYMSDKHQLRIIVTKEKAEEYKKLAEAAGKSLNQFVIDCIEKEKNSIKY